MSDTNAILDFERAEDDGLGEFVLPHLEDAPADPADLSDSLDGQIMAALVSP